jgi:probable rRNA maturation factor
MSDAPAGLEVDIDVDIEIAVPCTAWRQICPGAEAIAAAAARLALASVLRGKLIAPDSPLVLGVRLSDDTEQRQLNRTYRGKNTPTNVLSFPLVDLAQPAVPGLPLLLGDVVLALETVQREAVAQRKPLADHLRHLVVHGVLHLLGFDHEGEPEAAAMEAREIEILAALGVPDPYCSTM